MSQEQCAHHDSPPHTSYKTVYDSIVTFVNSRYDPVSYSDIKNAVQYDTVAQFARQLRRAAECGDIENVTHEKRWTIEQHQFASLRVACRIQKKELEKLRQQLAAIKKAAA